VADYTVCGKRAEARFLAGKVPQGLKPGDVFAVFTARLKPCPVTKHFFEGIFSAACEAVPFKALPLGASC
jgi:hypothetical protein